MNQALIRRSGGQEAPTKDQPAARSATTEAATTMSAAATAQERRGHRKQVAGAFTVP